MSDDLDPDLTRRVREQYDRGPTLDAAARDRLLQRIRRAPRPGRPWLRIGGSSGLPRVGALAGAAALVVLIAWSVAPRVGVRTAGPPSAVDPTARPAAEPGAELVRFQIAAVDAERVVLVGDFNDWDPQAAPMERAGGSDTWAVTVAVPRGRHVYAFLVNGERWLADPVAPLAPDDGFGTRNSVVVVGGVGAS